MSSMVCQGLQFCLEPPRGLGRSTHESHTLYGETNSDSDSEIQNHQNINITANNNDCCTDINMNKSIGGWSLIQALTNSTQIPTIQEKETSYIHPLDKRYSSNLSKKSLELCTESLGCENGTDIREVSDISSTTSLDTECGNEFSMKECGKEFRKTENEKEFSKRERFASRHNWGTSNKKVNHGSFPPPLTSISGRNSIQISPHREGGRLVIKSVVVPPKLTYFQAERCDGRLRLHLLKNFESRGPNESNFQEVIQEKICFECNKEEEVGECVEGQESENEYEGELDQETEVENDNLDKEIEENNGNVEGKMGIENVQRATRCKESGRGKNRLMIWEPFWVAT